MSAPPKEKAITDAVGHLRLLLGESAFELADHWDDDDGAVGLVAPGAPGHLVYVRASEGDPPRYYVELELPPDGGTEFPYTAGKTFHDVTLAQLATIVRDHLGL